MTLRSIDDSDGKDNVKIAIVAKQHLGRPGGTLFPYISFPSLHDCDVNLVNLKPIRFMCVTMCTACIYQSSYWQQIRQSQIYCVLDSWFFDSLTTDLHLIQRIQTKQKRLLKKDRFTKTGSWGWLERFDLLWSKNI